MYNLRHVFLQQKKILINPAQIIMIKVKDMWDIRS